jgi:6-phosphogluconolactonase/glucosamine-6-phosphate isomerase/deaminase
MATARPSAAITRPSAGPDTTVIVCADRQLIATRAVDLLVDALRAAIARRDEAHLALTGGSSAEALFGELRRRDR